MVIAVPPPPPPPASGSVLSVWWECPVCLVGVSCLSGGSVLSVWWECPVCLVGVSCLSGGSVLSVHVHMQGYALAGHCLVLLLATILDHMGSPGPFYLMWIVFGGLTSLKMVGFVPPPPPPHPPTCSLLHGHAAPAGGGHCVTVVEPPTRPCTVCRCGWCAHGLPALPAVCLPPDLRGPGRGCRIVTHACTHTHADTTIHCNCIIQKSDHQ